MSLCLVSSLPVRSWCGSCPSQRYPGISAGKSGPVSCTSGLSLQQAPFTCGIKALNCSRRAAEPDFSSFSRSSALHWAGFFLGSISALDFSPAQSLSFWASRFPISNNLLPSKKQAHPIRVCRLFFPSRWFSVSHFPGEGFPKGSQAFLRRLRAEANRSPPRKAAGVYTAQLSRPSERRAASVHPSG